MLVIQILSGFYGCNSNMLCSDYFIVYIIFIISQLYGAYANHLFLSAFDGHECRCFDFFPQPLYCSFNPVVWIIILLYGPIWAKLFLLDRRPDI